MRAQLANLLTATRLGLAVAIFVLPLSPVIVWWLFLAALVTDYIDGPVARRLGSVTSRGQQLDLVADTVLIVVGIYYLATMRWLQPWAVIAIIAAAGTCWFVHRSNLWGNLYVRLAVGFALLAMYILIIVGVASVAYGWHAHFITIIVVLTVTLTWLYWDRFRSVLDLESA